MTQFLSQIATTGFLALAIVSILWDCSRVIDSDIRPYSNQWLENYKLDFYVPRHTIYASQLNFRVRSNNWYVGQRDSAKPLTALYEGDQERLIKKANACKSKFLNDGFATFEDMNLIARKCLRDETICHFIAKKFPVILVDECQDLSISELSVLSFLICAGASVHYIGDLHQAIYSFKDSCPEQFLEHLTAHHFQTMHLTRNFRSTQRIVDLCRKIGGIDYAISGSVEGICECCDCCYVEYRDEQDAITNFIDMLNRFGISTENSAILVRTQSAKQKLSNGFSDDYKTHPIINAIQLWQKNDPVAQQTALSLLAFQLQKWMGFHGKSNNSYFSDEVCSDSVTWRLLLRDIIVKLCADPEIATMDELAYGLWYSGNKEKVVDIIARYLGNIGQTLPEITIRTPKGTARQKINQIKLTENEQIRVETIHSVKGCTFDAVLLLSSPDARGKTGFWESWLKSNEESGRIGYVASTRPRYILCWGVSNLSDDQRQKLEGLGLTKLDNDTP